MKSIIQLVLALATCGLSAAYTTTTTTTTVPLLGWTSLPQQHNFSTFTEATFSSSLPESLLSSLPELCGQVTVIAEIPQLHASDLLKYSQSFEFVKSAASAQNTLVSISHFDHSDLGTSMSQILLESIDKSCGGSAVVERISSLDHLTAELIASYNTNNGDDNHSEEASTTKILLVTLEAFKNHHQRSDQHAAVLKQNDDFLRQVSNILPAQHTFMLTGSPSPRKLEKRSSISAPSRSTVPFAKLTIFQKYVFFNTGIFASLFIIVILITILLAAVMSVSSLQTPTRFETKRKNS